MSTASAIGRQVSHDLLSLTMCNASRWKWSDGHWYV